MGYTRIQTQRFSLDEALASLTTASTGGVAFYVGTVRARDEGRNVAALHYEAYPEMAESILEQLRQETIERFGLLDAIVIHRTGRIPAGEPVLLVALAGRHRAETFDAVRHLMDRLKEVVPIWKKEEGDAGATWILGEERRRASP